MRPSNMSWPFDFTGIDEAAQRKLVREFARQIGMPITESDERLH